MTDQFTRRVRVPDAIAENAERFEAAGAPPAVPRLAATVILLRPAPRPEVAFEIYTQRRVSTMAFAPNMYAFPGGSVDAQDRVPAIDWTGGSAADWALRMGLDPASAQAVVVAAVRELFEEAGVLLAGRRTGPTIADLAGLDREPARRALFARERTLAELLTASGLCLRADLLVAWARWLTPPFEPRRFDTFFFLALLPDGQGAEDVSGEADHSAWLAPGDAAQLPMLPPTAATLRELATFPSIDAVLGSGPHRDVSIAVMPYLESDEHGTWMVLR